MLLSSNISSFTLITVCYEKTILEGAPYTSTFRFVFRQEFALESHNYPHTQNDNVKIFCLNNNFRLLIFVRCNYRLENNCCYCIAPGLILHRCIKEAEPFFCVILKMCDFLFGQFKCKWYLFLHKTDKLV